MGTSTAAASRPRGRRPGFVAAVAVLLVIAGGFGFTAAIDMKDPVFLLRFLFTPRSEVEALYDTRMIAASSQPRPIPERLQPLAKTVPWKGNNTDIVSVLQETRTNAFLVMCRGTLVNEWYSEPGKKTARESSWSIAKSVVGLLVGQLVAEGKLSEDTKLVAVLPEFAAGGKFDEITDRADAPLADALAMLVRERHAEGEDLTRLVLADPQGRELPAWSPGAHVDLITGGFK
eukprot:gene2194-2889_t